MQAMHAMQAEETKIERLAQATIARVHEIGLLCAESLTEEIKSVIKDSVGSLTAVIIKDLEQRASGARTFPEAETDGYRSDETMSHVSRFRFVYDDCGDENALNADEFIVHVTCHREPYNLHLNEFKVVTNQGRIGKFRVKPEHVYFDRYQRLLQNKVDIIRISFGSKSSADQPICFLDRRMVRFLRNSPGEPEVPITAYRLGHPGINEIHALDTLRRQNEQDFERLEKQKQEISVQRELLATECQQLRAAAAAFAAARAVPSDEAMEQMAKALDLLRAAEKKPGTS